MQLKQKMKASVSLSASLIIFQFLFFQLLSSAHNGKLLYAEPINKITIDGQLMDWSNIEKVDTIFSNNGDKAIIELKSAHDKDNRFLYLAISVLESYAQPEDILELYLNLHHSFSAPSNLMVRFEQAQLNVFKHDERRDPYHHDFDQSKVKYKVLKHLDKTNYEIQIDLMKTQKPYQTLGFDLLYIHKKKEGERVYLNWGKGYYGQYKEYNSGQLGDLVLLPKANTQVKKVLGVVSVAGKELTHDLVAVNICSVEHKHLWTTVLLKANQTYEVHLPEGVYKVFPAYKMTNPFQSWGSGNQLRIEDYNHVEFDTKSVTTADTLFYKLYEAPDYLIPKRGVLDSAKSYDKAAFETYVNVLMNFYNIPAASIAVIQEGTIAQVLTLGVRSKLTTTPVKQQDVFQLASVSKPIFAYLVNRYIDKGMLDLDKPLHQYLSFPNLEKDKRYLKMTARHVLSHRSGLPNWAWGGPYGWERGDPTELLFEPGADYTYSGEAFQYLGRVLEKIAAKDLRTILKEEIAQNLAIPEIYFTGNDTLVMVQGHVQDYPTFWGIASDPGVAHSMMSNSESLAKFIVSLIEQKGMSAQTYKEMFKTQHLIPADLFPSQNYWDQGLSLGFFTQQTKLGKGIMHGGNNGDFQSEFVFFPERKIGMVVLTNSNTGHKLAQDLGRYLFYGR